MTIAAGKSFGQIAQQRRQRGRAAGGGADRDQPIVATRLRGAIGAAAPRRRPRLSPTSREIVAILASSGRGAVLDRAAAEQRRVDGVERAMPHRLEDPAGVDPHAAGDDQDRARGAGHDAARGLHAVHLRHHQVHQDQIRRVLRAELHGLGAVQRDPDDAIGRIDAHHALQELGDRRPGR